MNLADWIVIALLFWLPVAFARTAAKAVRPGGTAGMDRAELLSWFGGAVLGLAIGRALLPWSVVPTVVWGVAAWIAAWGVITAARAWPRLPTVTGRRPRLRAVTTALGLACGAALVVILT